MTRFVLIFPFLLYVIYASSQSLDKINYSKVEVGKGDTRLVKVDSIRIDTLIMLSKSTLRFDKGTTIIVENAFLGEDCVFDSSGKHGTAGTIPGTPGSSGRDGQYLIIAIRFRTLGGVLINTSGGDGGKGRDGANGANGTYIPGESNGQDGLPGGNGGNGGNGGAIVLRYICDGFIPTFNDRSGHSISFKHNGGLSGHPGSGGYGGLPGRTTSPGIGGTKTSVIPGQYGRRGPNGVKGRTGDEGRLDFLKLDE